MKASLRAAWPAAASILAGAAASACCWLPLALGVFGASAAGLSRSIVRHRPWLAGLTVVLVAGSLLLTRRLEPTCEGSSSCASPGSRSRSRAPLVWLAGLLALALAFLPAPLLGRNERSTASPAGGPGYVLAVEGMTCAGCAGTLRAELADVPGVRSASVDHVRGRAEVEVEAPSGPLEAELLRAVERSGFSARVVRQGRLRSP